MNPCVGLRGVDLGQRLALLDQCRHTIANDGHHVAVVGDIDLIADPAPRRNHDGPSSRQSNGTDGIASATSRFSASMVALNAAAAGQIDDRKPCRVEHFTSHDDIGTTEEHHRVAIGVRRRLREDLDAFAVEVHDLPALEERLRRHRLRQRREARSRCAHALEAFSVAITMAVPPAVIVTRLGLLSVLNSVCPAADEFRVAADMIGAGAGVDDEPNRLIAQRLDRRQHRVGLRLGAGVDDDEPVGANLDADVGAGAGDHVEVRPHLHDFEPIDQPACRVARLGQEHAGGIADSGKQCDRK